MTGRSSVPRVPTEGGMARGQRTSAPWPPAEPMSGVEHLEPRKRTRACGSKGQDFPRFALAYGQEIHDRGVECFRIFAVHGMRRVRNRHDFANAFDMAFHR